MPTAVFVQEGSQINYTPGAAVAAGDVVVQGDLIGVAKQPIAANVAGALAVDGVFDFPKATGVGTAIAAIIFYHMAHLVPGVGIAVPILVPALVALAIGLILSWRHAPALAYIVGTLGTLIGADLANIGKLRGLGAPVASIGGAGTFDGIFLTGILAVLLAGLMGTRSQPWRV